MTAISLEVERLTMSALLAVVKERAHQDRKWGKDRRLPDADWLRALVAEVGEVASAMSGRWPEREGHGVTAELVQVAAVAVAWLESIQATAEAEADAAPRVPWPEGAGCNKRR